MNKWNDVRVHFIKERAQLRGANAETLDETQQKKQELFQTLAGEDLDLYLKDLLFIESGEDVEDIFLSFKVFNIHEPSLEQLENDPERNPNAIN